MSENNMTVVASKYQTTTIIRILRILVCLEVAKDKQYVYVQRKGRGKRK